MKKLISVLKERLKNEKGLTLVELLAVIVILGIIAAIAVPSIGGIIDNSKKDAHIANAETAVSAARLMMVSENPDLDDDQSVRLEFDDLTTGGYLESNIQNPSGDGPYSEDGEYGSEYYVEIERKGNDYEYSVRMGDYIKNSNHVSDPDDEAVEIEFLRDSDRREYVELN